MQKNHKLDSSRSEPVKLKFGIDQLLAEDSKPKSSQNIGVESEKNVQNAEIQIPCVDCVASVFHCCRLDTGSECNTSNVPNFFGCHFGYESSSTNVYHVDPIRPFPTRPSKFFVDLMRSLQNFD
ncbi:hypothetical protein HHI36_010274 [Cryptolaemus montrouzieri]|uniref:Uncharacterized protein n=1 Tax=Cryptolaemus montrouzieri TaxID=559131 RepID=A0ABD2MID1_9CUCU